LACFDDKQQIKISNKVSPIAFISAYVLMTFGKIRKIIELKEGGLNFVDISFSTFTG